LHEALLLIYDVYPNLNGTLDEAVIWVFRGGLGHQVVISLALLASCGSNFVFAWLILRRLRLTRATMSRANYKMNVRLTIALIAQAFFWHFLTQQMPPPEGYQIYSSRMIGWRHKVPPNDDIVHKNERSFCCTYTTRRVDFSLIAGRNTVDPHRHSGDRVFRRVNAAF
jgi:hypothetical protein